MSYTPCRYSPHFGHAVGQLGLADVVEQFVAVALEQLNDDFVFIAKMIVQVARADAEALGDVVGADVALTLLVEQLEADVDDSVVGVGFAGLPGHGLSPWLQREFCLCERLPENEIAEF